MIRRGSLNNGAIVTLQCNLSGDIPFRPIWILSSIDMMIRLENIYSFTWSPRGCEISLIGFTFQECSEIDAHPDHIRQLSSISARSQQQQIPLENFDHLTLILKDNLRGKVSIWRSTTQFQVCPEIQATSLISAECPASPTSVKIMESTYCFSFYMWLKHGFGNCLCFPWWSDGTWTPPPTLGKHPVQYFLLEKYPEMNATDFVDLKHLFNHKESNLQFRQMSVFGQQSDVGSDFSKQHINLCLSTKVNHEIEVFRT